MRIPFALLANNDDDYVKLFATVFDKQIAYASLVTESSGKAMLSFLETRTWDDLPSLILLDYQLSDMTAPEVLRELLPDSRYRTIPKGIWINQIGERQIAECGNLGVHCFLKKGEGIFECESSIRHIDNLLKTELSL